MTDRTVLVTGASSGIGEAIVRRLAAAGWRVHALARREDRLEVLARETGATAHVLDINDTPALEALVPWLDPHVVVSNAGIGAGIEGLAGATAADIDLTLTTNVAAMLHVIRLALPGMIERRSGHLVNIGSVAGIYPTVSAIYGASKAAVRMMSRNLRIELRGTGVRVSEICPGRVATEFYDAAVRDATVRERLKTTGIRELQPADVAEAVHYALSAPPHVNVSTVELQPLEQSFGGMSFDVVEGGQA